MATDDLVKVKGLPGVVAKSRQQSVSARAVVAKTYSTTNITGPAGGRQAKWYGRIGP